jgi:hypothetical protein
MKNSSTGDMDMKKIVLSLALAWTLIFAGCTPQPWETQAEEIAEAALPIAASVAAVAVPGAAPYASSIQGGAQALVVALQAAQKTPGQVTAQDVTTAVNSLQGNVQQLLAALQVKNGTANAQATAYANLFAQAIDEIAAIIEQNTNTAVASLNIPPSAIHVMRTGRAKGWKAKQIVAAYKKLAKQRKAVAVAAKAY